MKREKIFLYRDNTIHLIMGVPIISYIRLEPTSFVILILDIFCLRFKFFERLHIALFIHIDSFEIELCGMYLFSFKIHNTKFLESSKSLLLLITFHTSYTIQIFNGNLTRKYEFASFIHS